jgi:hypothetical protein
MLKKIGYALLAFGVYASEAIAASGPIAKDFSAESWMDKIHVVLIVVGLVIFTTTVLVYAIIRKQ